MARPFLRDTPLSVLVVAMSAAASHAQVGISGVSGNYSQNFNTLITTGNNQPWSNNTTLTGWHLFNSTGAAITTYNAGAGTVSTPNFYSFGTGTATERALGGVGGTAAYFGNPASGAVAGHIAVGFLNDTGGSITNITLGFNGEQWRDGGNGGDTSAPQTMVVEHGVGATFGTVSGWTAPGGNFNSTSPIFGDTSGGEAVDGNVAGLIPGRGGVINLTSTPLLNGQTFWFRWRELNDPNNDHGLAIDNVTVAFLPVPEPGVCLGAAAVGIFVFRLVRHRVRPVISA